MRPNSSPRPLDPDALDRLALRYVERYATTRAKLRDYLIRKIRERGWAGDVPPDPAALADRMAELRYVDDRAFAEARVRSLGRRGLGARRISGALRAAGITGDDAEAVREDIDAQADDSALTFARRKRLGPFATAPATDPKARDRAFAAMLRAGHDPDQVRRILGMTADDLARIGMEDR
ncbi:regulatory protein RecX [Sphingomonas floccifaciens]|uniref:Regulatory protein RecX n=1 Tax=Sphingomonas floccifaciens TaxID=1844115 RepID=A0ABW4NB92_9SPHN